MSFKGMVGNILDIIIPTLGESVMYKPKNGAFIKINAVFDRKFSQIDPETEVLVSSNEPRIGIKIASLLGAKPRQGDEVKIGKETFTVVDHREDGQGGASLMLRKVF